MLSRCCTIISFSSGAKEQVQYIISPFGFKALKPDSIIFFCLLLQVSKSSKLRLFFLDLSFITIPSQVHGASSSILSNCNSSLFISSALVLSTIVFCTKQRDKLKSKDESLLEFESHAKIIPLLFSF